MYNAKGTRLSVYYENAKYACSYAGQNEADNEEFMKLNENTT